jgi:hypothetical protein
MGAPPELQARAESKEGGRGGVLEAAEEEVVGSTFVVS